MLSLRSKSGHDEIVSTSRIQTIAIDICVEESPCECPPIFYSSIHQRSRVDRFSHIAALHRSDDLMKALNAQFARKILQ
jgi:hypothetical protein